MANLIANPNYDASKPVSNTNQPYIFENPNQVVNPATGQTAISAQSLVPEKPIELPQQTPDTTNYQGIIKSNNSVIPPPTPETNNFDELFKKYLGESTAPPSLTGEYTDLYSQYGIGAKEADVVAKQSVVKQAQNELNLINAQLKALSDESTAIPIRLQQEATGRGQTAGGLAPIQTAQLRDVALRSLPYQAQALVAQAKITSAQGDVETAQQTLSLAQGKLDTLFKLKSQDAENTYNYNKDLRDKVWEYATAKEKEKLLQQQKEDDREFEEKKLRIQNMQALAKTAIENGQGSLAAQISALDPASETFQQDLAKLQGQIKEKPKETTDITEYNLAVSQGYKGTLLDWQTRQANLKAIVPKTTAETRDTAVSQFLESNKGTDGFVDSKAYQEALRKFIANGGSQTNFFASYPQQTYLRQQEIDKLPAALKPQQTITKNELTSEQISKVNDAKAAIDQAKQRYQDWNALRSQIIEIEKANGFDISPWL